MSRFKTVLEDVEIIQAVEKHGTHDQKTHGNWATGSVPTSITTTTNAIGQEIQTITYGDIVIERDKPGEVRDAEDITRFMWTTSAGNDAMRIVASRIMGIDNPSAKSAHLNQEETDGVVQGKISPWKNVPKWIAGAYTLLEDIHISEPFPDTLHRGIKIDSTSSIMGLKQGQVIEMPISSTSTKRRTAELYSSESATSWEVPVFFTFAKGTKGTPIRFSQMRDGSAVAEYVTQGKFKVVSVDKSSLVFEEQWSDGKQSRKSGALEIVLEHTDTYSIDKGGYEPIKP